MTDNEQVQAAKTFVGYWKDKGYEKGESQKFWLSLLRDVYGVEHPEQYISFEDKVFLDHTSFIDGYIDATKILIEQKALGKDLNKPIKQSDGSYLTPFQQAKRYITELPLSKHPRWVVTCNFSTFLVYDMENPSGEPEEILLENLPKEYYRLSFLVNDTNIHLQREVEISVQAGDIVGVLYDAFYRQYKDPTLEHSLKSLNMLCVRLVSCLYAEDAGIFGRKGIFHDYLSQFETKNMRSAVIELFKILDQRPEERDQYLEGLIAEFPYVNGGLFADENIEIPQFTDEIKDIILRKASENFNWSEISPTIFGAVFESTLNPDTRRKGGMHYTSIENIHKVIDPLFFSGLQSELKCIEEIGIERTRKLKLNAFQDKLASLKFLDPACGSGNFLTETYISLRRLENRVINALAGGQMVLGEAVNPVKVSISQFYGIEINDFAVTVGKTALWIAESQMLKETENIVHMQLDFLPLKTNAYIVEGNALKINWSEVVSSHELSYIMGNPPFVGYSIQSDEQKEDILSVYVDENGKTYNLAGKIDYVSAWYFKASEYIMGSMVKCAFVSTNSITQGEQVIGVWKPLYERFNIHIDFAWRTFKWNSESKNQAAVHCVIIGFSSVSKYEPVLYINNNIKKVSNISPYLIDAPTVFVDSRSKPICDVPIMRSGGKPVEGGNLIFTTQEKDEFLVKEPQAEKYFRPFMGSEDFINNKGRWCLWLLNVSPRELRNMPCVMKRVEAVREFRLASKKADTRKYADYPTRFMEIKQSVGNYLMIPATSSENRRYIPIGYLDEKVIASNAASFVPDATLYHFGVLTSNVHMAWMRVVAGRLKSDYRYSVNIVYNNFPWCVPTDEHRTKIGQTAQAILDARALYPDCSLADLYDELTMPPELRTAHQQNDKAVMQAYGFPIKDFTESDCVAELMKLYQSIVEKKI